jgi:hypothetical protein
VSQQPSITYSSSGTTFAGPDAVRVFQASALLVVLRSYARQQELHGRARIIIGARPGHAMRTASILTGKTFRRNDYASAASAVEEYRDELAAKCKISSTATR